MIYTIEATKTEASFLEVSRTLTLRARKQKIAVETMITGLSKLMLTATSFGTRAMVEKHLIVAMTL